MKNMKKHFAALSILALCLALAACANTSIDNQENVEVENISKEDIENLSYVAAAPAESATPDVSSGIYEIKYGNTTGNSSNNAFVAQNDKYIYYLHKIQPGTELQTYELVKVDAETDTENVIFTGHKLSYLKIIDDYIYYIDGDEGRIYRVREDGSESIVVSGKLNNISAMVIVGDYIFCRAADSERMKTLYSISLETGEVTALCPLESLCSGLIVNDGWIYYSVYEGDEWKSYRIRTDGTDNSTIGDFQLFSACIEADKIYYLDDNLQICSMDLDGAEKKILADGITAIRINVSDGWIYYSDTIAIYRLRVDGSESTKLCDFPSSNNIDINVLGEWIYLRGDGIDIQSIKAN